MIPLQVASAAMSPMIAQIGLLGRTGSGGGLRGAGGPDGTRGVWCGLRVGAVVPAGDHVDPVRARGGAEEAAVCGCDVVGAGCEAAGGEDCVAVASDGCHGCSHGSGAGGVSTGSGGGSEGCHSGSGGGEWVTGRSFRSAPPSSYRASPNAENALSTGDAHLGGLCPRGITHRVSHVNLGEVSNDNG